ncbi:multiple epidermal growth factor-like domains protein 10 isoform X1 [Ostrea edulis]|uniref:multiple epidermal growth factor-like domains protein 10 isoform X1 n=1 Tax=Ostrea edulis TaxID=37623 RepID=UPI0024AF2864|nr:multiple epidermal growth factor-like domains protein 10 isoform X1 [Ostrea edulis]
MTVPWWFCFILLMEFIHCYENLALRRPAWQQHNYSGREMQWGAAKAVDGLYTDRSAGGNQCTQSNNRQTTATWRVDLESVVSISHIDFYYRTDNLPIPSVYTTRFAGFYLYVSNTTSKDDGHLCFHEIQTVDGTPIENQTISCSVHGRYVIYYNERKPGVNYPSYYSQYAFNELCEVEVNGCPDPRYYGVNCNQPCPDGCQEKRCDVITSQCLGCIPGYQGPRCSQVCAVQTYGLECSLSCGNCSDGETCHHATGMCPRGCNKGVEGDKCQTPCQPGYYGKNCGQRCSENCKVTNHCNRFTGDCDRGCKPGWKIPTCQEECDGGMYGAGCTQSCGPCLHNNQCHHINGTCLNGCSSGYQGWNCKEKCPSGYFGINCENKCTVYCGSNGSCDHVTGICESGCKEGWSGPICGTELSFHSTTCTDDNTAIIISLVVSIIIVLIGSVINFLMWKRNQPGNAKKGENCTSETRSAHNSDTERFRRIKPCLRLEASKYIYKKIYQAVQIGLDPRMQNWETLTNRTRMRNFTIIPNLPGKSKTSYLYCSYFHRT